jgi:signal transduction histidine kinase/ActR/RegA family two-component response regulator
MIHVLYAEDDPNGADAMRQHFEANAPECTLEIAPTGSTCLDRMRQGGIDVLLLDLVLPDIDGLHVLGELANRGDNTPVVMVSGHGQTELAVKALRAGAVDCVEKNSPQFLQIVDIVKRLNSRRQAEPAGAPPVLEPSRRHRVVLIETSEALCREVRDFFAKSALQLDLHTVESAADLDGLASGPDSVVIGPEPGVDQLDLLRMLRSRAVDLPVILLVRKNDGEAAVAAFMLGAQDYILQAPDYLTELVFSLKHILHRADLTRSNSRLARELETVNRSLEAQVAARTRELEALSMRFIRVREDEVRAIAHELHDVVGQALTGLKLQLEAAALRAAPPVKGRLAEALAVATDLLARTRDLTLRLRPPILDDLGLQPAIEWHLRLFERQTGIAVESEFSLLAGRLPGELETTIFRIVQEALTNVARHSGSRTAHVMMMSEDRQVIVEIADRGGGFDPEAVRAKRDSLGLAGLVERARLAGGNLEIISRPGRGTRVHAAFPTPPVSQAS